MTLNDIRTGGLRGWCKLCMVVAAHLGFAFGFCTLVMALCGGSAYANIIGLRLGGIVAGLVNLVWCPVLALVVSVPLSAIAYLPFRWSSGMLSRGSSPSPVETAPSASA
jgi:hypothetical protein